jgi:CTP:phosphocholine cytidylyltransferase-like protein/thiamine kinase-like enzyme
MNYLALLCREIVEREEVPQRELADRVGVSLGKINYLIKDAAAEGLLTVSERAEGVGRATGAGIAAHADTAVNANAIAGIAASAGTATSADAMTGIATGVGMAASADAVTGIAASPGKGRVYKLTAAGRDYLEQFRVDNAIILAAGFGARFVPFTYETPKGLLKVKGVPMIEQQIEQLIAKGVTEILVVVGYLKEKFDYLIDKYGVRLVFNPEFAAKNNLASLHRALPHLKRSYVLCADHWFEENIFSRYEPNSWHGCSSPAGGAGGWRVTEGPHRRITHVGAGRRGALALVGPAFLNAAFSEAFRGLAGEYYGKPGSENLFWEDAFTEHLKRLPIYVRELGAEVFHEFDDMTALRAYDSSYDEEADNAILRNISNTFGVPGGDVTGMAPLKDGLTNQSFRFCVRGEAYVFRMPGGSGAYDRGLAGPGMPARGDSGLRMPARGIGGLHDVASGADTQGAAGAEDCISRANEKQVYEALRPYGITDEVIRFDAESGMRITRYYAGAEAPDPYDDGDLLMSMRLARRLHDLGLTAGAPHDIAKQAFFYHGLADEIRAVRFSDIGEALEKARELSAFRDALPAPAVLCHGEFQPSNILRLKDGACRLIDWEHSGIADPLVDVALYGVSAGFGRERMDHSLRLYLEREADLRERARLYLSVAFAGLGNSMWAEYKQGIGQEFGTYPLVNYRYFKEYYNILKDEGYLGQ